jgi:predicted protein tyrosine phosphatase
VSARSSATPPDDVTVVVIPPHIVVHSREGVRRFRGIKPYIVISIHPPEVRPVSLRPDQLRLSRINLVCHDAAPEWGHNEANSTLFTPEQAERIARFITRHASAMIVMNCVAGISRSAGVAVGIRTAFVFNAGEFAGAPYDPNPHVARLVHDAIAKLCVPHEKGST